MSNVVDDILEHHGVKGMRWGQRNSQKKISRADKKFEKTSKSHKTHVQVYNNAVEKANKDLDRINSKSEYKDVDFTKPSEIGQKYEKEINDSLKNRLQESANSFTNKSGTRKLSVNIHTFSPNENDWGWTVSTSDIEHDTTTIKIIAKRDKMGVVTNFIITDDSVEQGELLVNNILAHHGVKGMKWGRRQNNTPTNVTLTKTKKGKVKTSGGKNQPTHSDAIVAKVAVQKAKKSGIESLSNDELRQLAKRLDLEQKVSKLADDQLTSNGEKLLNILGFKTK